MHVTCQQCQSEEKQIACRAPWAEFNHYENLPASRITIFLYRECSLILKSKRGYANIA